MTDQKRYRLRPGVTLPYADWLEAGVVYVGHPVRDPRQREPAAVQLLHPSDPSQSEVLPMHLIEEVR